MQEIFHGKNLSLFVIKPIRQLGLQESSKFSKLDVSELEVVIWEIKGLVFCCFQRLLSLLMK